MDIFRNPQKYRTHENEVIRRDGSRVWISWTNKPVFDETGRFREVLSIGNDITERKVAEDELLASREQLKSMGAELSIAEERERQRIATEFHDLVGQNLALAKIKMDSLLGSPSSSNLPISIRDVRELIGDAIKELRSQIFRISPPILHMVGFEAAVESLCEKYQEDCGINVVFIDDGKKKLIDEDLRVTLYTMVRELLLNVAKHAKAKNVVVSVEKVEENIEIRVEEYKVIAADNGEDAVARFKEHHDISLVLSDVVMPGKNGKEMLDEIRKIKPGIKVVVFSGYTADIVHKKGMFEEGTEFITKPFIKNNLLQKIREVLDKD